MEGKSHNLSMSLSVQACPLLADVIDAEERADQVLRFPLLPLYGDAVLEIARQLKRPLLMPVGADGQRLLGAVELLCEGKHELCGWRTAVIGRDVLLVGVVGVSGLEVSAAAQSARRLGARQVHACAVDAVLADGGEVDSFTQLRPRTSRLKRRRSA